MATVLRVNFEPVSDILPVQRRDFALTDTTIADPQNAVALVDGEWMTIDSDYKLDRAADVTAKGDEATSNLLFPVWAERGRYDIQALRKAPVLWMGDWEADTRIFDAAAVVGAGAIISAVGQPVKVATIELGSRLYVGLVGWKAADPSPIVGYVTRLHTSNGGKLRIRNRR